MFSHGNIDCTHIFPKFSAKIVKRLFIFLHENEPAACHQSSYFFLYQKLLTKLLYNATMIEINIQTVEAEKSQNRSFPASGLRCEFHKDCLSNMDCWGLWRNAQTQDWRQKSRVCWYSAKRTGCSVNSRWHRGYNVYSSLMAKYFAVKDFFVLRTAVRGNYYVYLWKTMA